MDDIRFIFSLSCKSPPFWYLLPLGILYHIFQFFVNPFFDILINFFGCKLQQQVAIVFKSIANVAESRWLTEEGAKRRPEGASGARLES